jgi:hypothetical protein
VRFPEEFGPGTLSGAEYGRAGYASIGAIPPLLPPADRDRERDECERRNLLRKQVEQAALTAARNAMVAQTLQRPGAGGCGRSRGEGRGRRPAGKKAS